MTIPEQRKGSHSVPSSLGDFMCQVALVTGRHVVCAGPGRAAPAVTLEVLYKQDSIQALFLHF